MHAGQIKFDARNLRKMLRSPCSCYKISNGYEKDITLRSESGTVASLRYVQDLRNLRLHKVFKMSKNGVVIISNSFKI